MFIYSYLIYTNLCIFKDKISRHLKICTMYICSLIFLYLKMVAQYIYTILYLVFLTMCIEIFPYPFKELILIFFFLQRYIFHSEYVSHFIHSVLWVFTFKVFSVFFFFSFTMNNLCICLGFFFHVLEAHLQSKF